MFTRGISFPPLNSNMSGIDMSTMQAMKGVMDSPNIVCGVCGSKVFIPAVVLKKVPSLSSPTGKEMIVDIPLYVCAKCGEIPDCYKMMRNFDTIMGNDDKGENKLIV